MDSRREFIKKAAILAGATGILGVLPSSIQRALAINPASGSSWLDAEHVVILMQENRSFDHCFGILRACGVIGTQGPLPFRMVTRSGFRPMRPERPMLLSVWISRVQKLPGWVLFPIPGATR